MFMSFKRVDIAHYRAPLSHNNHNYPSHLTPEKYFMGRCKYLPSRRDNGEIA